MGLRRFGPDLATVVAVTAFVLVGAAIAPTGRTGLDPLGYLLLVAGALVLPARRRAPTTVLLVTTACLVGYLLRGYPGVGASLTVMVALFQATRTGHRAIVLVPLGALLVVIAADLTEAHGEPVRVVLQDKFLLAGWLVASAVMGGMYRQWTAYVHEVEQRAAEAERTREETALRRAGEERLRIARELHDSLTHSISIIKVQTGVAIHLARKRGEPVPEALVAVQEASGEAMRELRATLHVLRETDGEKTGLDRLPELVERARGAGLPVTVTVTGTPGPQPADLDRAAYRIVQEALTNIARHAGPAAAASVQINYGTDELTVRVDDDGLATPDLPPEPGVGLSGMRERVTALGGSLHTAPRPEGGFTVHAELPVRVKA